MNKQPIDTARDADLCASPPAMQRAARRARELAAQTGTTIVARQNGVIEHIDPQQDAGELLAQDPPAPHDDKT